MVSGLGAAAASHGSLLPAPPPCLVSGHSQGELVNREPNHVFPVCTHCPKTKSPFLPGLRALPSDASLHLSSIWARRWWYPTLTHEVPVLLHSLEFPKSPPILQLRLCTCVSCSGTLISQILSLTHSIHPGRPTSGIALGLPSFKLHFTLPINGA